MQLRQLTQLEQHKLEGEYKEELLKVQNLMDILNDPVRLTKSVCSTVCTRNTEASQSRHRGATRDFHGCERVPPNYVHE